MKHRQLQFNGLRKNQTLIGCLILILINFCTGPVPQLSAQITPPLAVATVNAAERKNATEIEYEVKAAFIYNFMKFVEWPKNKKDNPESNSQDIEPMTIGVLGTNPFGKAFDPILNKKVGNREIKLIEIESFDKFQENYSKLPEAIRAYQKKYASTLQKCEIVFISRTEKSYLTELLNLLANQAILTVSDLEDFAEKGGTVGFVTDQKKVRFEINLDSAKREKIQIGSQLLRLAKRVYK